MIADQSPSSPRFAIWVSFLNQDTATLHGPEKYAKAMNYPVFYADFQKVRRGHYTAEFIMLAEDPASTQHGEITRRFMAKLEEKIRLRPEFYLWSHKRWKLRKGP
jgi:Kdo2-lipid IVA lauroyltransferase/acyltransferase